MFIKVDVHEFFRSLPKVGNGNFILTKYLTNLFFFIDLRILKFDGFGKNATRLLLMIYLKYFSFSKIVSSATEKANKDEKLCLLYISNSRHKSIIL